MNQLEGESRGDDPGRKGSKKRVLMTTDGDRPLMVAWTRALSNTHRLKNIFVSRPRIGEEEEVEMDHIVMARDVNEVAVLALVWENPDVLAYVELGTKYLDARRFEALPSPEWVLKITYRETSNVTM